VDPQTAKIALEQGQISQDTYNAIVSGVGVSAEPMSNQGQMMSSAPGVAPIGPPPPPVSASPPPAPPPAPPTQTPFGPVDAPTGQPAAPVADRPFVRIPGPIAGLPGGDTHPMAGPSETGDFHTAPVRSGAKETPISHLGKYDTKLSPDDEADFKKYKAEYAPNDSGQDYDLRGAFKAGITPSPEDGHWPDTFKKPNHPTFSVESKYATGPDKARAGSWSEDGKFIPPAPPPARDAGGRLLQAQAADTNAHVGVIRQEQSSVGRGTDAEVAGLQQSGQAASSLATDFGAQLKQDQAFKVQAMARAQQMEEQSLARAKEIAEMKIDPNKGVNDMSSVSKVLSVIAGGLGGYSGDRSMMQALTKKNEASIAAQQSDIQNKKDGWRMEENIAARQAAKDGDWLAFRSAKRIESLGTLKLQIQGVVDQTKSAQVKEAGTQQILALDRQIQQTTLQQAGNQYNYDHSKEVAAAQAAAAQNARVAKTQEEIRTSIKDLMKGDANNAPMSFEEAYRVAHAQNTGIDPAGKGAGPLPSISQREKPGATKDAGERAVVVDGKDALATSKKTAEDWNDYSKSKSAFQNALDTMKDARDKGDVGRYDAARGTAIELYPSIMGYARGPSMGQIKVTMGPDAFPEYNHWYSAPNLATAGGAYGTIQGRGAEKLGVVQDTLNKIDGSMRQNTFGAAAAPSPAGATNAPKVGDVPFK
jgi:hypothetical protein